MCLAIYKPKGKTLPKEYAESGFAFNKDGAGFAYVKSGKLFIEKGLMTFQDFWNAFEKVQEYEAIIHFRMATHGAIEQANTHPFRVAEFALIHNGILDIKADEGKTDTETFASYVLEPLIKRYGREILDDPSFDFLLSSAIEGSKFVLLSPNAHYIINEAAGLWEDGIWYSNKSYQYTPFVSQFDLYDDETDDEELAEQIDELYAMLCDDMSDEEAEAICNKIDRLETEKNFRLELLYGREYEEEEYEYAHLF